MAFIDGGYTTSKNILKDLANIFTSANAKLNPEIKDELQTAYTESGSVKIKLKYAALNNTITFKKATDNSSVTPVFTVSGRVITFTSGVTDGTDYKVTYNGDRDWKIVFPIARSTDGSGNALSTPEAVRLDQISRISGNTGDRVILKTTTTPVKQNGNNDPFNTDPNTSTENISMYVEFRKSKNVTNPEDGTISFKNYNKNGKEEKISLLNNHYITVRLIDKLNELTGELIKDTNNPENSSNPSEWAKFSWFMDFRESLVDDFDDTPLGSSISKGFFLRPITLPSFYDAGTMKIQYWINVNNDRAHIILKGPNGISDKDALISYAYLGRVDSFKDNITKQVYYNDVVGNFALTVGSSTIPSKPVEEISKPVELGDTTVTYIGNGSAVVVKGVKTSIANVITLNPIPASYTGFSISRNATGSPLAEAATEVQGNTGNYDYWVDKANNQVKFYSVGPAKIQPDSLVYITSTYAENIGAILKSGEDLPSGLSLGEGNSYSRPRSASYKFTLLSEQMETDPIYLPVSLYSFIYAPGTYSINYKPIPKFRINLPTQLREFIKGIKIYKHKDLTYSTNNTPINPPAEELENGINNYYAISNKTYDYELLEGDLEKGYIEFEDTTFTSIINSGATAPTAPTRLGDKTLGIERDPVMNQIMKVNYATTYGENTGTGVSDIIMYQTRSGGLYERHSIAFVTGDEFMTKTGFNPSAWTNKYHLSNIYVVHSDDGYRGILDGAVVVDNTNIVNGDVLIVNEGSTDPEYPEARYRYFKINSPYKFVDASPNYSAGIAIKME